MYRTITAIIVILLAGWTSVSAQNQKNKFEQIKVHKVAYLTEKMDLSVSEAEKFWPLYNDFEESLQKIRSEARMQTKNPTNEEAKTYLFSSLEKDEKEIGLKRDFYEVAAKVISYQKLYLLEQGEREFRIKLLERYKNLRKQ